MSTLADEATVAGDYMLTTTDNPHNPFTDWDEWWAFDRRAKHDTLPLLARITRSSSELSEPDQALAIQQAMDEIVDDFGGIWIKVPNPLTSKG